MSPLASGRPVPPNAVSVLNGELDRPSPLVVALPLTYQMRCPTWSKLIVAVAVAEVPSLVLTV